jgi:glycosyltransferase involved in cell wall biosynthesis
MSQRLLVVSPVHNEAPHIERVARALAAQQRPPDMWIVVDDASTDGTFERLRELEREPGLEFLTALRAPVAPDGSDRLALANEVRAFNYGLQSVGLGSCDLRGADLNSFTHVAKLDGDVELPPEWYAVLLERFAADPRLGIACGQLEEGPEGARGIIPIPSHHVHGAVKLYSLPCFTAIGGLQPRLGWDTIDETYARMHGFSTCSFPDPVAIHHRPFATRDGVLRGRARHGACAYIAHQSLPWVAARAVKVGRARPVGIGGGAFLYGYLRAAIDGTTRVEDPALRRFVRRELRARVRRVVAPTRVGPAS